MGEFVEFGWGHVFVGGFGDCVHHGSVVGLACRLGLKTQEVRQIGKLSLRRWKHDVDCGVIEFIVRAIDWRIFTHFGLSKRALHWYLFNHRRLYHYFCLADHVISLLLAILMNSKHLFALNGHRCLRRLIASHGNLNNKKYKSNQ